MEKFILEGECFLDFHRGIKRVACCFVFCVTRKIVLYVL